MLAAAWLKFAHSYKQIVHVIKYTKDLRNTKIFGVRVFWK